MYVQTHTHTHTPNIRGKIKRNASNNTKRKKRKGDLITIYKLMNNLVETDRKDQILRKKEEARNLKEKLQKGVSLNDTEKNNTVFHKKSIDTCKRLKKQG